MSDIPIGAIFCCGAFALGFGFTFTIGRRIADKLLDLVFQKGD